MKHIFLATCLAASALAGPGAAGNIDLRITGIPSDEGPARIVLMQSAAEYTGARPVTLTASVPVWNGRAVWQAEVPPGRYAIIAYHDRNNDDHLNRPLFGLPLEPYGYSGGVWTSLGLPEFEDAAFEVGDGPARQIIHLRMNAFVSLGQVGLVALALLSALFGILALRQRRAGASAAQTGGAQS